MQYQNQKLSSLSEKPKGQRLEFSKKNSMLLTPNEVILLKKVSDTIINTSTSGITITNLYQQVLAQTYDKIPSWRKYQIKYLLMLLWKSNDINIRSNNGNKVIHWRDLR